MSIIKDYETNYIDLLSILLDKSQSENPVRDRTGTGTYTIPYYTFAVNLNKELPILYSKKIHWFSVVVELIAFLQNKNLDFFQSHNVKIWDKWSIDGKLINFYGKQWNDFGGINQLKKLVSGIKTNPYSRRHVVSAWNPPEIDTASLPPCHITFQVVIVKEELHLMFNMRSTDVFLGLPFNILSYALLAHLIGYLTGYTPTCLYYTGSNVHLYSNHVQQATLQLNQYKTYTKKQNAKLLINSQNKLHLSDFNVEDIKIIEYYPAAAIPAPIAV